MVSTLFLQWAVQSLLPSPGQTEDKDGVWVPSSKQCPLGGLSSGCLDEVQSGPLVVFALQTRGAGSSRQDQF